MFWNCLRNEFVTLSYGSGSSVIVQTISSKLALWLVKFLNWPITELALNYLFAQLLNYRSRTLSYRRVGVLMKTPLSLFWFVILRGRREGLRPNMHDVTHRVPVRHYLFEKWRRGVEYGKLIPWHHLNRTHCQSNQTIPVFGLFGP